MIDPADIELYFKLEADTKALLEKLLPHAQRVAVALVGAGAKVTGFSKYNEKIQAYGYLSDDEGFHIPLEYLISPDWEAKVAAHHERAQIRHEKLMARWEKEKKEREEAKDLEDLERLKKKYPNKI